MCFEGGGGRTKGIAVVAKKILDFDVVYREWG